MAAATSVIPLGLLSKWPLKFWLKAHVPSHALHLGQLRVRIDNRCDSLDNPVPVSNKRAVGSNLQKEGGYNGRLQFGLGGSVGGQSRIQLLVKP